MRSLSFIAMLFAAAELSAQKNCDCIDATELKKNYSDSLGCGGAGRYAEISDPDVKSLYWFEKEHNVSWFRFEVEQTEELTLEIIPENKGDDVDFILLKYDEEGFCDRLRARKILPVRTNLSRTSGKGNGTTGLNASGTEEFVHSGPGNPFSKPLHVEKGEVYYLAVDNVTSPGKFSMQAPIREEKKTSGIDVNPITVEKPEKELKTPFTIKVTDDETGQPVRANIDIAGYTIGEPFHAGDTSSVQVFFLSSQTITINCNAQGYVFYTKKMYAPRISFDATQSPANVDFEIRLKKVKVGVKVTLPNIKFKVNETEILPESRPTLFSLLRFMESNPGVKIEIAGHVNAPHRMNGLKMRSFSKKRARSIYEYLLNKGIASGRIDYKGYGNSQMIYKNPANNSQEEENRRVEIRIIAQ